MSPTNSTSALPLDNLAEYLAAQLGSSITGLSATEFAGGASNPTYLLESNHGKHVLRSKPRGKLVSKAHAIDREYRVINALGKTDFPVPQTLCYCDDDYLHEIQSADNFSESNLFYYAGKTESGKTVGGIIRVANRPNQAYAEATVLYFPGDESALFHYERPEISDNTSWKVSGWDLDVITPGGIQFKSAYKGKALYLKDSRLLANPKVAYAQPKVDFELDLMNFGKSPMAEFRYQKKLDDPSHKDISATKGLHQLTAFSGKVAVGENATETIDGYGWRDHNWGPRNWQAFPKHVFYTANFGDERGFVLFQTEDGMGYFMHQGPDKLFQVTDLDIVTDYAEDGREPTSMRAKVTLDNGETHIIEGQQVGFIPLRNRRDEMTTHLGYSLWNYQLDGHEDGCGVAEHLSQSKTEEGL